ncbi:enoyl-CoA hydratase/isomerase family protein [Thermodesulfobacteriota bacterium]
MNDVVLFEKRKDIIVASINRPHKLNAADLDVYHELERALEMDAKGYIFTGVGDHFSAGDDITMFSFEDYSGADDFIEDVQKIFKDVEAVSRPVVAAVNGYALRLRTGPGMRCHSLHPGGLFRLAGNNQWPGAAQCDRKGS